MVLLVASDGSEVTGERDEQGIWLSARDFRKITGFELRSEGFCQGDMCIPVPAQRRREFKRHRKLNLDAYAALTQRPLLCSNDGQTWVLEESGTTRENRLRSLLAPDFKLPDLDGRMHALSDQRGKKVLLVSWASW